MAAEKQDDLLTKKDIARLISELTPKMHEAADAMEFEEAANLRDRILLLKDMDLGLKQPSRAVLQQAPAKEGSDHPRLRKGAARSARRRR
jgi:excinuclease ABC subunit B